MSKMITFLSQVFNFTEDLPSNKKITSSPDAENQQDRRLI